MSRRRGSTCWARHAPQRPAKANHRVGKKDYRKHTSSIFLPWPLADIQRAPIIIRFWERADINSTRGDVCLLPKTDITSLSCPQTVVTVEEFESAQRAHPSSVVFPEILVLRHWP